MSLKFHYIENLWGARCGVGMFAMMFDCPFRVSNYKPFFFRVPLAGFPVVSPATAVADMEVRSTRCRLDWLRNVAEGDCTRDES